MYFLEDTFILIIIWNTQHGNRGYRTKLYVRIFLNITIKQGGSEEQLNGKFDIGNTLWYSF